MPTIEGDGRNFLFVLTMFHEILSWLHVASEKREKNESLVWHQRRLVIKPWSRRLVITYLQRCGRAWSQAILKSPCLSPLVLVNFCCEFLATVTLPQPPFLQSLGLAKRNTSKSNSDFVTSCLMKFMSELGSPDFCSLSLTSYHAHFIFSITGEGTTKYNVCF